MPETRKFTYPAEQDLSRVDERVIYLALKAHFSGRHSKLRRVKSIRAHVFAHKEDMWIKMVLDKYGIENVCIITQRLLKNGIFDSNTKTTIYFPAPPIQARRAVLEAPSNAHRSQLDQKCPAAISEPSEKRRSDKSRSKDERQTTKLHVPVIRSILTPIQQEVLIEKTNASRVMYIPPGKQFLILRKTQDIMEHTCFAYAQTYLQATLSQKQWTCAESVELNEWTRILREQKGVFNASLMEQLPRAFNDILDSLNQLRHTAVHRNHKPLHVVRRFVTDAVSFSKLCENKSSSRELETLLSEL
jgi:hypothetical protein